MVDVSKVKVTVDCERWDSWPADVGDNVDLWSCEGEEMDDLRFTRCRARVVRLMQTSQSKRKKITKPRKNTNLLRNIESPNNDEPFSPPTGRLKTFTMIHPQILLYSFNASSPKPKKAKKMRVEAGRVHQRSIIVLTNCGGNSMAENKPTREKLLWTFSQLIHGRRPDRKSVV